MLTSICMKVELNEVGRRRGREMKKRDVFQDDP
jgi:hypothetical protein